MKHYLLALGLILGGHSLLLSPLHACNRAQDSLELVQFYQNHNGPNWAANWDLNQPMQTWLGVSLHQSGCVKKLSVFQKFTGTFPDLQLPELEKLSLTASLNFSLEGSIPDFSGIPLLKSLRISSHDSLSGPLPDFSNLPLLESLALQDLPLTAVPDFSGLPNLIELDLTNISEVSGPLPNWSMLPNLEELVVLISDFSGNVPAFNHLTSLKELRFSGMGTLTGSLPDFVLPNLEHLSIRNCNQITGPIPDFQHMPKLQRLNLGGGKFLGFVSLSDLDGQIPNFSALPQLAYLDIWYTTSSDTIPNFSQLPELKVLNIVGKNYTGTLPSLDQLPKLTEVRIGGYISVSLISKYSEISGSLPSFANLVNLKSLELSFNRVEGSVPNFSLPNLEELILIRNSLSGPLPEFSQIPKLEILSLGGNKLTGTIPGFTQLPAIQEVQLWINQFDSISSPTATISELNVSYNQLTFEDILPHVASITDYEPQNDISVSPVFFFNDQGKGEIDLRIDEQVMGSTYTWYQNGMLMGTTSTNHFELPANASFVTPFMVNIINPGASGLTLETIPFTLDSLVTAIEPEAFPELQVYPNPAQRHVFIDCTCQEPLVYEWLTVRGKRLARGMIAPNRELDLSAFSPGVYVLRLQDQQGKTTARRIVLQ